MRRDRGPFMGLYHKGGDHQGPENTKKGRSAPEPQQLYRLQDFHFVHDLGIPDFPVCAGRQLHSGDQGMLLVHWAILFTTSCFANPLGLNISSAFNSAITIYILLTHFAHPTILGGRWW